MNICGIIGYPLKNPKTLLVWSKFLKKNNLSEKIILEKYNIRNKNFKKKIINIFANKKFKALAVTMPYKKKF